MSLIVRNRTHPAAEILEAADGRDEDDKDPAPDLIEVEDDNDEAAEESVEAEWSTSRHLFISYGKPDGRAQNLGSLLELRRGGKSKDGGISNSFCRDIVIRPLE